MSSSPRLRITYCLDNLDAGGTELNAVRTAERLDRERFDVRVLAFRAEGPLRARLERAGIPIHEVALPSLASAGALRQLRTIVTELRRDRPDVLHCHDRYTNIFGVLAGRLAGVPAVIASRRWWSFDKRSHAIANAIAYRAAHAVLANSASVARLLEEEGVPRRSIVLIPNFVDDDAFDPAGPGEREELLHEVGAGADAVLIGIVANLRPVKDHRTLVRAFAALAPRWPELCLVCVGSGPTRAAIESLASELGVADRVHLLGQRLDARKLQRLMDITVLCSLHEGSPNAVIEGMAAGRAVVATDVGGVPDAVLDGETGFLVSPGASDEMAIALERLLADPSLRERMGAAGRKRAYRVYHSGVVLPALEALYERLRRGARADAVAARESVAVPPAPGEAATYERGTRTSVNA